MSVIGSLFDVLPDSIPAVLPDDPRSILQEDCLAAIDVALGRGVRHQLVRLPTGSGKTRLSQLIFERFGDGRPGLFCVHRIKLANQSDEAFREAGLRVGVEQANKCAMAAARIMGGLDVVVASKDTMKGERLWSKWSGDHFGVVVVDEAHRALGQSFTATIERFSGCRLRLLQTATPKKGLVSAPGRPALADELTFNCEIDEAVARGVVTPFRVFECDAVVNLKDLRKVKGADYDEREVEARIIAAVGDIAQGVVEAVRSQGGRKGIMFVPGVEAAIRLAAAVSACGIPAEAVYGNGPNHKMSPGMQKDILKRHRRGDFELLISCELLTEGYDDTEIDYVVMARPTKQVWLHWQMAGRGLRKHGPNPEKVCMIYGFGYDTEKGRRSSLDLFYADMDDPKAALRAAEESRAKASSKPVDPLAERKEAEQIEEMLRKQEELWRASLDPVRGKSPGLIRDRTIRELGGILSSKPSLKKLADRILKGKVDLPMDVAGRLARAGMRASDIERFASAGEAEAAADEWEARSACGMSSWKQHKLLLSQGYSEAESLGMTKAEAHRHIGPLMAQFNRR